MGILLTFPPPRVYVRSTDSMIPKVSVRHLLREYAQGRLTPSTVFREIQRKIDALETRIEKTRPRDDLGAVWISRRTEDDLVERATDLEKHFSVREKPLYGIPFAVKDNIDVKGMVTTNGLPGIDGPVATESSPVVAALEDAGAIVVGKTNMDQLATGLVGTRSPYGPARNAIDGRYISGGSSSGSATAVAAGLCSFALGTDTAGSGRVPAALQNIYGWKPSRGLLSLRGVRPACRTLDTISIFGTSVDDVRVVAGTCSAYDSLDSCSRSIPAGPRLGNTYRAAIPDEQSLFLRDESVRGLWNDTIDALRSTGAEIVPVDYGPFAKAARLLYEGPWVAERFSANRTLFEGTDDLVDIDPVVRSIVQPGCELKTHDAFDAMYRLMDIKREVLGILKDVDCLVHPTTPTGPMRVEDVLANPVELNSVNGYYTNHMNLLDMCGLAVPVGSYGGGNDDDARLPFGATISSVAGHDDFVLDVGSRISRFFGIAPGATRRMQYVDAADLETSDDVSSGSPSIVRNEPRVPFLVCGAHMSGLPLNEQLKEVGAHFVRDARTSDAYRMVAFDKMRPPRPGMYRVGSGEGAKIACEIWDIPVRKFGDFVHRRIAKPLGIAHVELEDGTEVQGFVCEAYASRFAIDITAPGGWRAFLESSG